MSPLAAQNRRLWRSLEEKLRPEAFADANRDEFPASALDDFEGLPRMSRRSFLKTGGIALGAAALASCSGGNPAIVPYVRMPERTVPGVPKFYATSITKAGIARGVLAESHLGRPTRLRGNPEHSECNGALDAISQAAIISLYDPRRSKEVRSGGGAAQNDAERGLLRNLHRRLEAEKGEGVRILTGNVTSPSHGALLREFEERYTLARWHQYEPCSRELVYEGTIRAFGRPLNPVYDLSKAEAVLSVGGDFLGDMTGALRYAADFIRKRREGRPSPLFAVESRFSLTGARADVRLPAHPAAVARVAEAVAALFSKAPRDGPLPAEEERFVQTAFSNLRAAKEGGLVIPGEFEDPSIQALCHHINGRLGSIGTCVRYTTPLEVKVEPQTDSLKALTEDMKANKVRVLVILDSNPCYAAPADLLFADALKKVETVVHAGYYVDETARAADWHIPLTHELERWGDARSFDGSIATQQPIIAPLTPQAWSPLEVISALLGREENDHDLVKGYWRAQKAGSGDFEEWWRQTVHDGVIADSALPSAAPEVQPLGVSSASPERDKSFALVLSPDSALYDGRYAGNAWLEELPKPLTKLSWDNALLVSPSTARNLQLEAEMVVEIKSGRRTLEVPVWIVPGMPEGVGELALGFGHAAETRGQREGANAYLLRTIEHLWSIPAEIRPTRRRYPLASTQSHHSMHGRDLIRVKRSGGSPSKERPELPSLYPEPEKTGKQNPEEWGMSINLDACIGCSACVIACQSENNIPWVGKEGMLRGREMHWLRVDRYFSGGEESPETYFQPVPCMHCENAPCELVCPVAATVHSDDGLNEQVYNRCVGTRYCSSNCPYKVRRFNFFHYTGKIDPLQAMYQNPNVTVRSRGVMEKCTYCVQRISRGRITAEIEGRDIRDGEVTAACQEACPTQAIVFGNLTDRSSAVNREKADPDSYGLLSDLNTRPRTTYLPFLKSAFKTGET